MNPVNSRARIVGGRKSQKGWWPWQIGLHKVGKMYEMTSFSIIKHQEGGGTFVIFFSYRYFKEMFFLLWFAINTPQTNSLPEFMILNSFLLNISLHLKSGDMLNNFHVHFCVVVLVNQVLCNYILHDYMHVCHLFRPWGKQAYLWWRLNISPVDFDCSALFLCLECLPEEIRTRRYP